MRFVHVAIEDASPEEIQKMLNRALSCIASISELAQAIADHKREAVPLELLGIVMNDIMSGKDDQVEAALNTCYEQGIKKNTDFFTNVNGKANLPDNVVPFPVSKRVH